VVKFRYKTESKNIMDDNQPPVQESTEPKPVESLSEPNIYEPQPRMQPLPPESSAPKKSRKKLIIIILLVLLLVGAGAAYFMTQEEDSAPVESSLTTQDTEQVEEPIEEPDTDVVFQSALYPDLSFTVPDGWEVTEPENYDDNGFGEGSVNGTITVTDGDVTLKLDLVTVLATGFEGYRCYDRRRFIAVGDVYRFVDSEGTITYADGISETDDEWAEVIANEGEFTSFEDPDPNYCVSFPFIGTYSSTLNQADYPDQPYGFADKEKAIVWLSALIEGAPNTEQQADTDAIIESLSQPDLGV
jgi:hypothetical protein